MMVGEPEGHCVMFDFSSNEELQRFTQKQDRLFGEGSFEEVGKHTDNIVLVLGGSAEDYSLARSGTDEGVFDANSEYHNRRSAESLKEIREAVGEPPEGMSQKVGTDTFGKGAEGLPQQFLELLFQLGAAYGGFQALHTAGKHIMAAIRYLRGKYSNYLPLLNKGGVASICAVDLVENRGVQDCRLVSAIEAQEGHKWDPTIDERDVYYVTFMDKAGEGHLYVATSQGAILSYSSIPIAQSWEVKPSFLDDESK